MILSVSPNLGIDVTIELDALRPGEVHRAHRAERQAGGKGVNVARALSRLGESVQLLGFAGGTELARLLAEEGIAADLVPLTTPPRTCTIYLTPDGAATVVNEAGAPVDRTDALLERYRALLPSASAVAIMGSLPPGAPPEAVREMVALARRAGRFCIVDTSGDALASALTARPSAVCPNLAEAEALLGRRLATTSERLAAAAEIQERGAELTVLTLGADGAVVAGADGWSATLRVASPVDMRSGNPTGAGDAFVAGLLAGRARGFALGETLRFAAACAVASLAFGYGRIRPRDIRPEEILLDPPD